MAAKATPVTALLETCKDACDEITELVEAVYAQLAKEPGAAVLKADKSFFSLADGVVQAMLMRLLSARVGAIVGEEDEAAISIEGDGPFRASDDVQAPAALEPLIVKLRGRMDALASAVEASPALEGLTAFIDPIDGTKEFCSGLGEQCSICVGFADAATGMAVGGLVYRPLCAQRSWALGCKREGVSKGALRELAAAEGAGGKGAFLCSNGGTSPFLQALLAELGYTPYPAGGAGNKALLLLELPSACYIQDRGVSRWDTCAAQVWAISLSRSLLIASDAFGCLLSASDGF